MTIRQKNSRISFPRKMNRSAGESSTTLCDDDKVCFHSHYSLTNLVLDAYFNSPVPCIIIRNQSAMLKNLEFFLWNAKFVKKSFQYTA